MLDRQRIIYPKGPVGPQRISFERFPPTEDANLGQGTPTERRERKKWPPADDMVLINCWLNTSKVAVDGTEQKSFWKRIEANYAAASPQAAGGEKREPSHCKQRWSKINDLVCKFCVSYEAAKREKGSGEDENEVLTLAHQIFYNEHKRKFTLEHAWTKLRNDPKWCEVSMGKTDGSNKKRRCEDGAQSSSSQVSNVDGQATMRPPGVKAAKDKGKKSLEEGKKSVEEGKVLSEFQSMWTIKEKDLAMKERLAKISLLDTLLAKKELSEIEEALKNKLISDILSN